MSTLLERQASLVRELLEAGDLETATAEGGRMVRLHPLEPEARELGSRVALARGDTDAAGAHLFLSPGDGSALEGGAEALAAFEERARKEPLEAFLALGLRDVPAPDRLEGSAAGRLGALLERLAERDYPAQRLDAMLYGMRRGLPPAQRAQAIGCLTIFTLAGIALVALAVVGFLALVG
jgi:hypothetical protein